MISKGVVMEVKKDYGIVLSDQGMYEKVVKKGSLSEGDRIIYTREDIYVERNTGSNIIFKALMSAAMLIFAIGIAFGFEHLPSQNVYAVVSMDINPSIQYYLDKEDFVIRTQAMNEDGQKISDCGLEGLSIEKAINRTLEEAEKTHYLKADSKLIVSAVDLKSGKADYAEKIAGKIFEEPMIVQKQIEVFVLEVDSGDYEESRNMETSLGKYKIYELCENDSAFSMEEINKMKATEIIEKRIIDEEKVHVYKNLEKDEQSGVLRQSKHMKEVPEKTETSRETEHKREKASVKNIAIKRENQDKGNESEVNNVKTALSKNMEIKDMPAENKLVEEGDTLVGMKNTSKGEKADVSSNCGKGIKENKEDPMKLAKEDFNSGHEKQAKVKVAKNDRVAGTLNIPDKGKDEVSPNKEKRSGDKREEKVRATIEDDANGQENQAKEKAARNKEDVSSQGVEKSALSKNQGMKEKKSGENAKETEPGGKSNRETGKKDKSKNTEAESGKDVEILAFNYKNM